MSSYVALSFLSFLIQSNLSPASIGKILAGVSFFLKFAGLPALTSFFQVTQVLKGLKKSRPSLDNRRPISIPILIDLLQILQDVCSSNFESLLFKAAFSIAFFGALRLGEFTAANRNAFSFLRFSHVQFDVGSVRLFLSRSKSSQVGQWFSLSSSPNEAICPVFHVRNYLLVRPLSNDSFFIHEDLSSLTRYQFSAVLASCLKRLNLSGYQFSSHSFRIGAATTADSIGFSESKVKKVDRWGSNRYKLYVRPSLLTL